MSSNKKLVLSFRHAFEGILIALIEEHNLKFHILASLIALMLGIILDISRFEWLILIITIGFVICIELTNTAIEEVVNSFTQDVHPSAKKAKDVAAGAVLVVSITALVIGAYIFLPYLLNF